ncbi:dihydrodipicolinate synthase family protein [Caldibacillus lycopersici]|uniref:Dihydrodipicolinate synthase family protein n=1 Tax=Perspicuibacillus lycopersici TaxID=1325689 RepID=A0AAE3LU02_9BACI|nr:dihydrodipicolinate synthase family protein [Perspicuibacillus lycopersici]MCU9614848.1 dihydrodipicolinate synthase family protein [Perspicuibacillus lycopersici]
MQKPLMVPRANGSIELYRAGNVPTIEIPKTKFHSRTAFSAAHVVSNPLKTVNPLGKPEIDWEATLSYRRHLWSLGFSVAEAMDTAQRGMGLTWDGAKELIRLSSQDAQAVGGKIASGAGTDHLAANQTYTLDEIADAYAMQCSFIEEQGSQIILMASRALAANANGPEDYAYVYQKVLSQINKPAILHWLGEMFDPALRGYWGKENIEEAMEVCLQIISDNKEKIEGIKISLLNADKEIVMRRRLPDGIKMYTGDDFNYPELIRGDEVGFSHALLGIFDAIAPAAAAALNALDNHDYQKYDAILGKTVPLSRHLFQAPTYSYKTGIVFMAYLNGHQQHFRMVNGAESARSITHLAEAFILADQAGLLHDPEMATERMRLVLKLAGIE